MSLTSHLLKHFAISTLCSIPWPLANYGRDANKKPCYTDGNGKSLEFNVSHQAGLVTIVVAPERNIALGTDIVCVNERGDHARIEAEGFFDFVDLHSSVFAPSETQFLKLNPDHLNLPEELCNLDGYGRDAISRCQHRNQKLTWKNAANEVQEVDSNTIIDAKLRRFYALWCLREAYVKMTGEALLAEWLTVLEFRKFRSPIAATDTGPEGSISAHGEVVTDFEIWFRGKRVTGVVIELRALGQDYMVGTAARPKSGDLSEVSFPGFQHLNVESDIYPVAQAKFTLP